MNDIDTGALRRALRAPQEPGSPSAGHADVAEIITRGRRLRWRRRAMAAGGSVCLAAAVVGAVAGIGRLSTPSPGPAQHVISPVGPARTTPSPRPSPDRGRNTPSPALSATAVPSASPTPTPTTPPATTATPQALPTQAPTRTAVAGATASASSGYSATSTPTASASGTSTDGGQPSATPSAAGR